MICLHIFHDKFAILPFILMTQQLWSNLTLQQNVNKTIDEIATWFFNHGLLMNEEKTNILYFKLRNPTLKALHSTTLRSS